ncbi:MAG: polysaccharide deacetylase family protein [bacterium]|jgi:peptidoglycan/xylan/chitin deacetylase (PgdA/CDA1 family)
MPVSPLHDSPLRPPLPPIPPTLLDGKRHTRSRIAALTFDACWAQSPSRYDARITRILREKRVPATFFLGGKWMEHFPDATRDLAHDPNFEIGNHTYSHPHLPRLSDAAIRDELNRTQDVQFRLTGRQGTLFRPPFGDYNERVVTVAASVGLKTVMWDCESGDPDPKQKSPDIIEDVLRPLHPGSILIFHINGRGWHTAEALPRVIDRLLAREYRLVSVSEAHTKTR